VIESLGVELERLVRYCHPAKILATTRLPGALDDEALAALYGASAAGYRALADDLGRPARAAAGEMAGDGSLRRLALGTGDAIVALGDSHTDDLASWAAILGHLLPVPVVNAGVSGDTTTAARARLDRLPAATIAVVLLGTNDARRHGRGAPMLVSHAETARNLAEIGVALRRRGARVLWVTPPPLDERLIRAHPDTAGLEWRLADVAFKADLVRELDRACVDLWPGFGARHLEPDGLHPSGLGQRLIAERVLDALAGMASR
jgi:lysophospholipase L1-like esterase